mmetsp:Transcript_30091/g.115485  ORF Transcript_30091/g.115485 Transcript_30091/m.115485 type:complete len:108 (+) Transcript_30091:276-599(+)
MDSYCTLAFNHSVGIKITQRGWRENRRVLMRASDVGHRVLILGGTGRVGQSICRELQRRSRDESVDLEICIAAPHAFQEGTSKSEKRLSERAPVCSSKKLTTVIRMH